MSAPNLVKQIMKRPWLDRWIAPLAEWYREAAGYRKLGLRADDLIAEESETVLLALKRLPPKEAYDRVFRIRRAFQVLKPRLSLVDNQLIGDSVRFLIKSFPKINKQSLKTQDYQYLSPIIREIEAEAKERGDLEALTLNKKKAP